jgi:hypothetical protein
MWLAPDGEAVVPGVERVSGYHEGIEFYAPQFYDPQWATVTFTIYVNPRTQGYSQRNRQ